MARPYFFGLICRPDNGEHAVAAFCSSVLKRLRVVDNRLHVGVREHPQGVSGAIHIHERQTAFREIVGGGSARHRANRYAGQVIRSANARQEARHCLRRCDPHCLLQQLYGIAFRVSDFCM
jgi:hypothetical protein